MLLLVFPAALNNWGFIISQCFLRAAVISDTFLLLLCNFMSFFFIVTHPMILISWFLLPLITFASVWPTLLPNGTSRWGGQRRRPIFANLKVKILNWQLKTENTYTELCKWYKKKLLLPNDEEANDVVQFLQT